MSGCGVCHHGLNRSKKNENLGINTRKFRREHLSDGRADRNPFPLSTRLTTIEVEVLSDTQGVGVVVQQVAVHILCEAVANIVRELKPDYKAENSQIQVVLRLAVGGALAGSLRL
jgi:hypothetical protein